VPDPTTEPAESFFGGHEQFAASPEKLFSLLTDLDSLAATIPDLVSAEKIDERTMRCVVRPGFSFLRGTMKLEIVMNEVTAPDSATMNVSAHAIGLAMKVISHLKISALPSGSALDWSAQIVERKGLIVAVSSGLIKAAADQVIRHSWTAVRRQLRE
jgi:carbon monoxide dehydrogenase subunit G